jgi:hypothetical protein
MRGVFSFGGLVPRAVFLWWIYTCKTSGLPKIDPWPLLHYPSNSGRLNWLKFLQTVVLSNVRNYLLPSRLGPFAGQTGSANRAPEPHTVIPTLSIAIMKSIQNNFHIKPVAIFSRRYRPGLHVDAMPLTPVAVEAIMAVWDAKSREST